MCPLYRGCVVDFGPNPSRPITMIVPFVQGGLTDVIGCVLAEGMRTSLGGLAD
jgi:tripartite-type tricarboxylate transporter receptor subunit TctC